MSCLLTRLKLYVKILKKATHCIIERIAHPGAAYLVLTPEHGNLGDHAIAQAEHNLFKAANTKVIEVSGKELMQRRDLGLLRLMNGRTIYVNGGGNLGTLWFSVEKLIRSIIISNSRSSIYVFPSTIYYENSEIGEKEKKRSVAIYNAHKDLTLCFREKKSYQMGIVLYPKANVKLMPDMAMYLNYCEPRYQRHGCILSLRTDREKTRNAEQDASIVKQVEELFGTEYYYLDMVLGHSIPLNQRDKALSLQFEAFKHSELVITDRLHAMIFCAVTGTPCIVIDSKSHKLVGCYEWIHDLEYIRYCDNVEEITKTYHTIPKRAFKYDNSILLDYYKELLEEVSNK